MELIKVKNYSEMSRIAANILSAQVILFPESVLGLSTGDTPIGMYKQLIEWNDKGDLSFSKVKTFNLDEYIGLSKEHGKSYSFFMWNAFFSKININKKNTYIPNGLAKNIQRVCKKYDEDIKKSGGIDLQVLGLGVNGHIGFNEPNAYFKRNTHKVNLSESTLRANSRFFDSKEEIPNSAITMGMGTIMQAKRILLLCTGKEKSEILYKVLFGDIDPRIPGSILQLHKQATIVADEDALSVIKSNGLL